jgi:hypothetical protein
VGAFKLTGADVAALFIFALSLLTRAALQAFARPGQTTDYGWIMIFAGVAATWLSLGSRIGDTHRTVEKVDNQTNGGLDDRLKTTVREVLSEYGVTPPGGDLAVVPAGSSVTDDTVVSPITPVT